MKITVLTDNVAGSGFLAEHGLSYLIEVNNHKLLLDTGSTDVFLKNAERLGIDIQQSVDTIVLSHGHWDHGNGLRYLHDKTLITHPDVFIKRYRKNQSDNIGLIMTKQEIEDKYRLITSYEPYKIFENIYFLGRIPLKNNFEAQTTTFEDENRMPDFVKDDSAIAIVENGYLHVVTGCSHAGICNIVDYAVSVTGISKIKMVIGGFHLKKNNEQTQKTIEYLKQRNVELIYPSHCTEFEALVAFAQVYNVKQLKTGMVIKTTD